MTEHVRNLAVGLTVLAALAMLGGMIVIFAVVPVGLRGGYPLHFEADSTHEVSTGTAIHMSGMRIGQISEVRFIDPANPTRGVRYVGRIQDAIDLPGHVKAFVWKRGIAGRPYLELKAEGPERTGPSGQSLDTLPRDGSVVIDVEAKGGELIPEELRDALAKLQDSFAAFDEVGQLARTMNEAMDCNQPAPATDGNAAPIGGGLKGSIARLNRVLQGLDQVFGDPASQRDLKATFANAAAATAEANQTFASLAAFATEARAVMADANEVLGGAGEAIAMARGQIGTITGRFIRSIDELSDVLAATRRMVTKIESGKGTAGRMLNDPTLYDNLVAATEQLQKSLQEVRELIAQWKKSGVGVKLK